MQKGFIATGVLGLLLGIGIPMTAFQGDAKKGETAFENCSVCHNADSNEDKVGPGLKGLYKKAMLVNGKPVNDANVRAIITDGSGAMPGFADGLTAAEKDDLIAYLKTL